MYTACAQLVYKVTLGMSGIAPATLPCLPYDSTYSPSNEVYILLAQLDLELRVRMTSRDEQDADGGTHGVFGGSRESEHSYCKFSSAVRSCSSKTARLYAIHQRICIKEHNETGEHLSLIHI